jgi:hypothetical protein
MSGPIVRKYGFPNFDKIFGKRPLEHGADDDDKSVEQPEGAGSKEAAKRTPAKKAKGEPNQA